MFRQGIGTSLGILANILVSMNDEDFNAFRARPDIDLVGPTLPRLTQNYHTGLVVSDFLGAVFARRPGSSSSVCSPVCKDGRGVQSVHLTLRADQCRELFLCRSTIFPA